MMTIKDNLRQPSTRGDGFSLAAKEMNPGSAHFTRDGHNNSNSLFFGFQRRGIEINGRPSKGLVDGVKIVGGMSLNVGRANLSTIPTGASLQNSAVTCDSTRREMSTNVTASSQASNSPSSSAPSESNPLNSNPPNGSIVNPIVNEQQIHFQQQLLQLKQQQELQQRLLLQHFQQQQQQLAEQHEKQLQERIKEYLDAQKKFEEEQKAAKERLEKERLEALKKKEKHEHSAIASSEVKQRLQEFVLNKKQREAKQAAAAAAVAGQTGLVLSNSSNSNSSPPACINWNPLLGKYEDDLMPLRKTASEPNLKIRSALKQKVLERRSSPLLRRKLGKIRGRPPLCSSTLTQHQSVHGISSGISSSAPVSASSSIEGESNTPPNSQVKSTPASPPPASNGPSGNPLSAAIAMGSSSGSAPILEEIRSSGGEGSRSPFSALPPDLQLYSSPSLPNISLGRPHVASIGPGAAGANGGVIIGENVKTLAEAPNRSIGSRLLSSSMPGSSSFPTSLPFYPSLPVIEGEFSPPTSPTLIQNQMKALEHANVNTSDMTGTINHFPGGPITETQVALARLQGGRTNHRPLGRTQSAPLPLGHPMLQSTCSSSHDSVQHQRNLLKQHIRQTVLTRASSKQQLQSQSFEEETEAAVAQEMKDVAPGTPSRKERIKRQYSQEADLSDENDDHLIDLTKSKDGKDENNSNLIVHHKERETFLQQQRDLISSHASSSLGNPSLEQSSVYQQILYQQQQQQQQQMLLLQQQQQQQQQQQSSAATAHQPHTVALLPEGNQFPQILPFSRYPYYHPTRPLSRASSSPLVAVMPATQDPGNHSPPVATGPRHCFTTGIVYDSLMLKHQCICGDNSQHPEHGGRLQSIWARLQETGLAMRCERIRSRKATLEEIQLCHSEPYSLLFGTSPLNRQKLDPNKLTDLPIKSFVMLPCGGIGVDSDTTWNELHTASAAKMAAGCVIELAVKVAIGEIKNGFAIVRPPGHHAEAQQAMGFCFFNSVAIAVQQLKKRLNFEKILIVDWDVHHGNGIQQMFYDDPRVLYISLHRHDDGNFFPGTGDPNEIGADDGIGFNVNIAWSGGLSPPLSDAEYLAAFRSVVMPIARDFDPEIILVASGFDAASGHPAPLGGYHVSPACFAWMTKQLLGLAQGKVVLALEGGYDLPSICDCSQECVAALLGDEPTQITDEELRRKPLEKAIETIKRVVAIQAPHWPIVKRYVHLIDCSHLEAQKKEREECEAVSALASLTMQQMSSPPSSEHGTEEPMDQDVTK